MREFSHLNLLSLNVFYDVILIIYTV